MKRLGVPLFAILCLFVMTGAAVASEAPDSPATATLDLFAAEVVSIEAPDCSRDAAVALGDHEPTFTASNNCSIGCSVSSCQGVPRGNPCSYWDNTAKKTVFGSCNLNLGIQCSDGTGWDCVCYGQGGQIP